MPGLFTRYTVVRGYTTKRGFASYTPLASKRIGLPQKAVLPLRDAHGKLRKGVSQKLGDVDERHDLRIFWCLGSVL